MFLENTVKRCFAFETGIKGYGNNFCIRIFGEFNKFLCFKNTVRIDKVVEVLIEDPIQYFRKLMTAHV